MVGTEKRLMKAWLVREKDEFCATVVFAETRGKARALALHTEACEDADWLDIDVYRKPNLDKYYVEGKWEMDWFNKNDRLALVKDGGFTCDPWNWEPVDCERCPATEYCDAYKDRIRESEDIYV